MALGQLDGVAIGVLDPGNVIFASGPVGSRKWGQASLIDLLIPFLFSASPLSPIFASFFP